MLKLWKRKDSPCYYARGAHLGISICTSLGTRDRAEAEKLLAKLQAETFEAHLRGPVPKALGFAAAALTYMQGGGERRFIEPLWRHFGDTPIDRIDQAAIDNAATTLYPQCSPATRNRRVHTPISAILKRAGIERDIKRPKVREEIRRALTWDEAVRLIAACAPHLRPLVMFLLLTGARIGEALWLDWSCVDLARGHVSFLKTKNGEPRGVPLHRDLVRRLPISRTAMAAYFVVRTASLIGALNPA